MTNRLNIDVLRKAHHTLMRLEGRLDTLNAEPFSAALQPEIEKQKYLVLDFSQCNYLSSSGIRVLITAIKSLSVQGGNLMLTHLSAEVFQVLEMAGLHTVIPIFTSNELAEEQIFIMENRMDRHREVKLDEITYLVDKPDSVSEEALLWITDDLVGYDELGISAGIGSFGEGLSPDPDDQGLFVTLGNCAAVLPFNASTPPDFRVVTEAKKGALFTTCACSFPGSFAWKIQPASNRYIHLEKFLRHTGQLMESKDRYPFCAWLIANRDPYKPALTLLFEADHESLIPEPWFSQLTPLIVENEGKSYAGIRFMLDHLSENHQEEPLTQYINQCLTLSNIESVRTPDLKSLLCNPLVWIFTASKQVSAEHFRIKIEPPGGLPWEPYKNYLVRTLYSDSARVALHPLHGGFSAQTFQADSFDSLGRRLRPTVLKIAGRNLITREAERCQKYALPYIMNNSAQILGTSGYLNQGALRYNFVGIGGEQSQLQWLTHYYNEWPAEKLEPLFDKIFLNILKPWYGQPVRDKIPLYSDHNPARTFFPHLCETAEKLFSLSADDKQMKLNNENRIGINPYWFLKHYYPKHESRTFDIYKSICHGDLNMQNILLDDQMNVYLIDFSETRPRSTVSDFARLEAILMVERAPLGNPENLPLILPFTDTFYSAGTWGEPKEVALSERDKETLNKNLMLIKKMREYATRTTNGCEILIPYCLALLEWVLPIVCYQGVGISYKKLSAHVASRLCETILEVEANPEP